MKNSQFASNIVSERRAALKKLLAVSGITAIPLVPEQWVRPVISTALIPAHGAASSPVILEEFFATPASVGEVIDIGLEFSTVGIPDGTEVIVRYASDNRTLQESDTLFEGEIQGGIPIWAEGPFTQIEVDGDPLDANVELEISFEESGIPEFETSTSAENFS